METPREDHHVHLSEVSWDDYERLLEIRGERAVPRISYLQGLLEIMSPTRTHGFIASIIGRLIGAWCLDRGIEFSTCGCWTIKDEESKRGAEPDECYVFGTGDSPRPHLAIEVVWTSGGIDKLEIYRELGVAEVWYWKRGTLRAHALREDGYHPVPHSQFLPGLDLDLIASFVDAPTTSQAIRGFREAIAGRDSEG